MELARTRKPHNRWPGPNHPAERLAEQLSWREVAGGETSLGRENAPERTLRASHLSERERVRSGWRATYA